MTCLEEEWGPGISGQAFPCSAADWVTVVSLFWVSVSLRVQQNEEQWSYLASGTQQNASECLVGEQKLQSNIS